LRVTQLSPRNWTIRARIALTIFAACSAALLLMALAVFFGFRHSLLDNFDDNLQASAIAERNFVDVSGAQPSLQLSGQPDDLSSEDANFVRLLGKDGSFIAGEPTTPEGNREKAIAAKVLNGAQVIDTVRLRGASFRVFAVPIRSQGGITGVLIVGGRRDSVFETLGLLSTVLLFAVPSTSGVVAVLAFFIARRALRPVHQITQAARNIAAGDLSQRIGGAVTQDEVGELATTFNRMIERLEETIERERRFTGDASHELRTPLTAIEAALEVTLSQERTPEQYRVVLESVKTRTGQMTRMARQLLLLSRMDAQAMQRDFVTVQLNELLSAVMEAFSDEHPQTEVTGHQESPLAIHGDPELLARAFTNILDNAAIHAPGASITVGTSVSGQRAVVTFSDNGPGISLAHLPNILQRFERGNSPQERTGAGLGLAIVESIAQAHKGSVEITSSGSGTCVLLFFPLLD
jgi:signal transduction histidine kinase